MLGSGLEEQGLWMISSLRDLMLLMTKAGFHALPNLHKIFLQVKIDWCRAMATKAGNFIDGKYFNIMQFKFWTIPLHEKKDKSLVPHS